MCYAPITIKNNSKLYRPLVSKDLVKVPCGKCRECQLRKENDWFVRIYYEWLRTKQLGGDCYFVSITYNDENLSILDTSLQKFSGLAPILQKFFNNTEAWKLNDDELHQLRSRVDRYQDRYGTLSLEIPFFNHSSFNDLHVTSFFKALRQYLNDDRTLLYSEQPLKYFLVCEYGDNKHRPHYHVLIFVPKKLDPNYFLSVCRKSWSYHVKQKDYPKYVLPFLDECKDKGIVYMNFSTPNGKDWKDWHILYQPNSKKYVVRRSRGFVNYSKDEAGVSRPVIQDIKGCKYLTRYLNYYDNYIKDEGFEQLKDWIKLFPNIAGVSGYKDVHRLLSELKLVFPFKRVSQNFGSLLLEQYSNLSEDDLKQVLSDNQVIIPNDQKSYPIPSYIVNRLCYDRVDIPKLVNPVSFFTPLGYKVFKDTFEDKIQLKVDSYKETLYVLRKFLTDDDKINLHVNFNLDLSLLGDVPFGFSLRSLALFDVVLNGVSVSHMGSFMRLDDMSANEILENCYDIYLNQLLLRTNFIDAPEVLFDSLYYLHISNQNYLKRRCYNSLEQFIYYDKFLTILDYIRRIVLERDAKQQQERFTSSTVVREALNQFRYRNNY